MKPPIPRLQRIIINCWARGADKAQARSKCIKQGMFPSVRMVSLEYKLERIEFDFWCDQVFKGEQP